MIRNNGSMIFWWCEGTVLVILTSMIVMFTLLYSATSHAQCATTNPVAQKACEDVETLNGILGGEKWAYDINHYGLFTDYPLYLIADTDNNSRAEDIIFGFNSRLRGIDSYPGDASGVDEKMRLTDEGRLGIGTFNPDGILEIRAITSGEPYSLETHGKTIARFGSVTHAGSSGAYRVNHYGLKLKVHSWNKYGDPYMKTRVGFNLSTAEQGSINRTDTRDIYKFPNLNDRSSLDYYTERRAMTMELDPDWPTPRVAIGFEDSNNYHPVETLDVNGAIRIGDSSNASAGTLRYSDGSFEGHDGSQWLNLGSVGDSNVVMHSGNQLVFGTTASHRTPNNFIVNSQNVPSDDAAEFPIPATGSSYNNDDEGTSGGMSLVAGGLPRFTVKGNGNTYVHKRLSIGIGGHVPDTVLTVAGSVHIGPDNLTPTIFDYGDQLADYLLWVEKGIVSEDFAIANVDNWSDHVLQNDYDLKPLSEVESFIEQEGHLPGVPSAEDVKDNGYTVHEMTRTLLGKVEELTLHTIAQQKAIDEQKAEIAQLRAQLSGVQPARHATSFQVKTGF